MVFDPRPKSSTVDSATRHGGGGRRRRVNVNGARVTRVRGDAWACGGGGCAVLLPCVAQSRVCCSRRSHPWRSEEAQSPTRAREGVGAGGGQGRGTAGYHAANAQEVGQLRFSIDRLPSPFTRHVPHVTRHTSHVTRGGQRQRWSERPLLAGPTPSRRQCCQMPPKRWRPRSVRVTRLQTPM